MKNLKQYQDKWFKVNAPLGILLGYPDCCIKEFCAQPPELLKTIGVSREDKERFAAGCIDGNFTGLVPCKAHAKQILSKQITIFQLIKNRSAEYPPFPHFAY